MNLGDIIRKLDETNDELEALIKERGSSSALSGGLANEPHLMEILQGAIDYREADHVFNNKHRMGMLGSQNIDFAINNLKEIKKAVG